MRLLRRILVPVDFRPASEAAVRMAAFAAARFDSEISLLHVVPSQAAIDPGERERIGERVKMRLAATVRDLHDGGISRVQTLVDEGVVFQRIIGQSRAVDANLIVMGGGAIEPGGRFDLGTTAAETRRRSATPVWIVRPDSKPRVRNILCPVDGSVGSALALKNAIHLSRRFGAELTVLQVVEGFSSSHEDLPRGGAIGGRRPAAEPPGLAKFLRGFDFHDVVWTMLISRGKPHREILRIAREGAADLVVMGSQGRGALSCLLSRLLMGGVARKIADQMPCAIITVRVEGAIQPQLEGEVPEIDVDFCATKPTKEECVRLRQGDELLEQGFSSESLRHFQQCVTDYPSCARAWNRLAVAHQRLGHVCESEACKERAKHVLQLIRNLEIQEEVRAQHPLYRPIFGIKTRHPINRTVR